MSLNWKRLEVGQINIVTGHKQQDSIFKSKFKKIAQLCFAPLCSSGSDLTMVDPMNLSKFGQTCLLDIYLILISPLSSLNLAFKSESTTEHIHVFFPSHRAEQGALSSAT